MPLLQALILLEAVPLLQALILLEAVPLLQAPALLQALPLLQAPIVLQLQTRLSSSMFSCQAVALPASEMMALTATQAPFITNCPMRERELTKKMNSPSLTPEITKVAVSTWFLQVTSWTVLISLRSKCDQASIKSIFTLALTVSFVHCSFDSVSSKGVSFLVGAKKTTTSFLPLIISTYLVVSSPPTLSKRSRTKFPPPPPKKSDWSRSHFFL